MGCQPEGPGEPRVAPLELGAPGSAAEQLERVEAEGGSDPGGVADDTDVGQPGD